MKTFYGGTFMNKEILEESGIFYPIKLEYYKREDENTGNFTIEVVKTEYKLEKVDTEGEKVPFIIREEKTVNELLNQLKEGQVPPIAARDVVEDLLAQKQENK